MPTPMDWVRNRPTLRTVHVAEPAAGNGAVIAGPVEDPRAAVERERREFEAEQMRQELQEEMAEDRELRRLRRQKMRTDLQHALNNPATTEQGADIAVTGLLRSLQDEVRDLRGALTQAQAEASDSRQAAAINDLRARIEQIGVSNHNGSGGVDPISQLVQGFRQLREVRTEIDHLSPPAAAPIDPGLSHQQRIELHRITAEERVREMELNNQLEEIQLKREQANADRAAAAHRIDQVSGIAKDSLLPVLSQVLGDRFGGAGASAAAGLSAPPAPPSAPGPPAGMEPWRCPQCNTVNYASTGSSSGYCESCHLRVNLEPGH